MQTFTFGGEDFTTLFTAAGWKIGSLCYSKRFSALTVAERHLQTAEAFVLLKGNATLWVEGQSIKMQPCRLYLVDCGEWHHIVVSRNAVVLVAENSNTTAENTEKRVLCNK